MEEVKDSIANVTTIAGAGAVVIDWSMVLTMTLLVTGILLNVVRIYEIRKRQKNDKS